MWIKTINGDLLNSKSVDAFRVMDDALIAIIDLDGEGEDSQSLRVEISTIEDDNMPVDKRRQLLYQKMQQLEVQLNSEAMGSLLITNEIEQLSVALAETSSYLGMIANSLFGYDPNEDPNPPDPQIVDGEGELVDLEIHTAGGPTNREPDLVEAAGSGI